MNASTPEKQEPGKPPRIGTGKTPPGKTDWKPNPNDARGICVEVDTSSAGFKTTPNYVASVAGNDDHWLLTGTSAINHPTRKGFSIFVGYPNLLKPVTPEHANDKRWHVTWIGAEDA